MKIYQLALIVIFALTCCKPLQKGEVDLPLNKQSSTDGRFVITAALISKTFVKKDGQPADFEELYLSLSVQDYFIKFCESEVSLQDLERYLKAQDNVKNPLPTFGPAITAEIEIVYNGNWDICDGDPQDMQSRTGNYVILKELIPRPK